MGKNDRHVGKNPKDGWDVKAQGAKRASAHEKTQADTERAAKKIVRNAGRIRDQDTVAPGRDPKDKKD